MSELYMMVTITNRKYMSKFAALYRENQIEVGTVSLVWELPQAPSLTIWD